MRHRTLNVEAKLAVLTIAKESGSVAFACFSAGVSRSTYYKVWKRNGLTRKSDRARWRET
jgi:hypothetical protein